MITSLHSLVVCAGYATVFDLEWIKEQWAVSWWDSIPPGIKIAADIVMVMLVALIFTSGFAIRAQRNAAAERDRANEHARVATSLGLAAQSNSLLDGPLDLALLLGVEAHRLDDNAESRSNLLNLMLTVPRLSTFLTGHTNEVYSVAFSPDGQTLASASRDNTINLWDLSLESWKVRACRIANRNLTRGNGHGICAAIRFGRPAPYFLQVHSCRYLYLSRGETRSFPAVNHVDPPLVLV